MSEITISTGHPDAGRIYAEALDRVIAERDALRETLENSYTAETHERLVAKGQKLNVKYIEKLKQRLTAADEMLDSTKAELAWQESDSAELRKRVEALEGLLRDIRQSCELSKARDSQIDAALKPAEGRKTDPRVIDALREAGYLRND